MAKHVIWLTGVSGAGKSTLALILRDKICSLSNSKVEILDGDVVRDFFEGDLKYSRQDRLLNIRRIAFAAKLLADHDVLTIVANIAPYYEARDFIRRKIPKYIQVYLETDMKTVKKRDVKGHYKNFEAGKENNLIGVDDNYEIPRTPNLVVNTTKNSPFDSANEIFSYLQKEGII